MPISPQEARLELRRREAKAELERRGLTGTSKEGNSFTSEIPRQVAMTGRHALSGALDVADFIGTPIREGVNLASQSLGSNYRMQPMGQMTAEGIDTATGGYTKPRNDIERVVESTSRAATGLPAGNIVGKAAQLATKPWLKQAGKGISTVFEPTAANIGGASLGAAAAQSAHEINPESMGDSFLLGLLGSGTGQTIGGLLTPSGRASAARGFTDPGIAKIAGKVTGLSPKKVEAFKEAGITPTLGDVVESRNSPVKHTQNILRHIPGAAAPINKGMDRTAQDIKSSLGPDIFSNSLSSRQVGKLVKEGGEEYTQKLNKVIGKLKDTYQGSLERSPIKDIEIKKPLEFFDSLLSSKKSEASKNLIINSPFGKEITRLKEMAIGNNGRVPFSDAEGLRTHIFNTLSKKEEGTIDHGQLERMRSLLNKEMGDVFEKNKKIWKSAVDSDSLDSKGLAKAKSNYKEALDGQRAWNRYNKTYTQYAEKRKPSLVEAKHTPLSTAETITHNILSKNAELDENAFMTAAQSLKGAQKQQFMGSIIKKAGLNKEDEWVPARFVSAYKKWQPESREAFKSQLPVPLRKKFDSIVEAMSDVKSTIGASNTSGTQYTKNLTDLAKDFGAGTASILGLGSAFPVSTIISMAAARGASKGIMTNPAFINWAYNGLKDKSGTKILEGAAPFVGRTLLSQIKESQNQSTVPTFAHGGSVRRSRKDNELSQLMREAQSLGIDTDSLF